MITLIPHDLVTPEGAKIRVVANTPLGEFDIPFDLLKRNPSLLVRLRKMGYEVEGLEEQQ